jgi:pimeloyl-ACP methyl ester carboxylesterase
LIELIAQDPESRYLLSVTGSDKLTIEQEVRFSSGTFYLAGTLATPDGDGPFPGVLLIAGSGQVDRNENHKKLAINVFREIAGYLAENGIATLRYDKRGVGASEGNYWETGFFDNVSDASSALHCLKAQKQIRPEEVFLLGHSEGALIATRLAAEGADVAGVILLAGPARSGEEVLKWQTGQVVKGMRGINKWLIKLLRINVAKAQQKQIDKIKRSKKDWYRVQLVVKLNARWMREFIAYNPAEDLPRIRVPVLAITGSKDIQVDPGDLKRMSEIMQTNLEYHEVPDVTHILRIEEGEPTLNTYKKQVQQPMDSRVMQLTLEWLREKLGTAQ